MKTKRRAASSASQARRRAAASHSKRGYKKRSSDSFSKLTNPLASKRFSLILFVTLFAAVGIYFLAFSKAATITLAVIEAETMALPAGASIVTDSAASASKAIKFSSNGSATGTFTLTSPASSLTVRAKGIQCQGAPQMVVKVDSTTLLTSSVSGGSWTDYTVTTSLTAASHTLNISFTNDNNYTHQNARKNCSRDLFVDKVTVYGESTQSTNGMITRSGSQLMLNGAPYRFTGINAYELSTDWNVNWGCGSMLSDTEMNDFFAGLRPNSVVRFWGYQAQAFNNKTTQAIDFSPIDRVVNTAKAHGQRVVIALTDQSGRCDDGHWRDEAWYKGDYTKVFSEDGRNLTPLSYWDYIHQIVPRYKDSPTIAMWELVNEPEAANCNPGFTGPNCYGNNTCPATAAASLKSFFDTVGAEIKRLDPNHLISSGVLGGGQCGLAGNDYVTVHSSPSIDVASVHDYGDESSMPPGVKLRIDQMKTIAKPLMIGEAGIDARDTGCPNTLEIRRDKFRAKMDAQFSAGIVGYMPWNWEKAAPNGCYANINAGDPTLTLLHDFAL